jgi:hypothetical protein
VPVPTSLIMPSRQPKPKKVEVPSPKQKKGQLISPGAYKVPKAKVRPYTLENSGKHQEWV